MADPNDVQLEKTAYEKFGATIGQWTSSAGGVVTNAGNRIVNDTIAAADRIPGTVGDIAGGMLGAAITNKVGQAINGITGKVDSLVNQGVGKLMNKMFGGAWKPSSTSVSGGLEDGVWESVKYASDLIPSAPKYKFLFKVQFGFSDGHCARDFYYYVRSIDKPKISFVYEDVNYYNYRTKVLTKTTHDPLSMSFYDDQTNTVFSFFQLYRSIVSPIANHSNVIAAEQRGMYNGPDSTASSSSGPGVLSFIKLQQLYGNGTASNIYTFINPRIENFDFDGVDHEDSQFNSVTVQFNYDNLFLETVQLGTIYDWGMTDLLKGGGSGGVSGGTSTGLGSQQQMSLFGSSGSQFGGSSMNGVKSFNCAGGQGPFNIKKMIAGAVGGALSQAASSVSYTINTQVNNTIRSMTSGVMSQASAGLSSLADDSFASVMASSQKARDDVRAASSALDAKLNPMAARE